MSAVPVKSINKKILLESKHLERCPFPIPVGWSAGNIPQASNGMFLVYIGWFITGLAAAQGSSFWFDVLKRLSGLRSQTSESSTPVG